MAWVGEGPDPRPRFTREHGINAIGIPVTIGRLGEIGEVGYPIVVLRDDQLDRIAAALVPAGKVLIDEQLLLRAHQILDRLLISNDPGTITAAEVRDVAGRLLDAAGR